MENVLQVQNTQSNNTQVNNNNSLDNTRVKPKIIKMLSGLFLLIAVFYLISSLSLSGIILIMDRVMGAGNLVFYFLKHFPSFGLIPVVFSLASLFFFYVAFKVSNSSKFSFWLALIATLIPFVMAFLSQALMNPFVQLVGGLNENPSANLPSLPINAGSFFDDTVFIFALINFVLLLFSFRKFNFVNSGLGKKAKTVLVMVVLVMVVPTTGVISYKYVESQDSDFGYQAVQSIVDYHVYKLTDEESGFAISTRFEPQELAGKTNAVQVVYDVPFEQFALEGKSKLIFLKQVGIGNEFNIFDFISTELSEPMTVEEVTLMKAKTEKAYVIQKQLGETTVTYTSYITPDDVLIFIASPQVSKEGLVEFANFLE